MLFLLPNIFKITTFWMKIEILRWVLKIGEKLREKSLKLKGKKTKLNEKTQNSREKLKVWEALASYVYPSDVKKMPALSRLCPII